MASTPLVLPNPGIFNDDDEYPMKYREKSVALIFNNEKFCDMEDRNGSDVDVDSLKKTFKRLNFEVKIFDNLDCSRIMAEMKLWAQQDHTNRDCIAVIVLTHGNRNGKLAASDIDYDVDQLLKYVIPKSCPTLAGKPKLFFIQACKGNEADPGVVFCHAKMDAGPCQLVSYPVASYADILISYATFEGQYAFRTEKNGSWYIQTLCDQLDLHATDMDLLTLLTRVNRIVNQAFRSNDAENPRVHGMVQAPSFTSSLTRRFCFRRFPDSMDQQDINKP